MDRKQAMCSVITTLLVFAMFSILPIDGQVVKCPWCDKGMQSRLLDCVYTEMIGRPELMMIPLRDIEDVKWQVASYSDSRDYMPYEAKKVDVDKKFVGAMANVIKKNNYQNNQAIINVISELSGNCYSSVTGYDPNIVTQDVKAMVKDDIRKSTPPLGGNPNPGPNSRVPYPANQNRQNNFQPPWPQVQPPLNTPFNPPVSSPVNSFNNPPSGNNAPFNPPGSSPVNSFGKPPSGNNAPFNPPGSSPVNSFGNPPSGNNAPFNSGSSFDNPSFESNAPSNPSGSSPVNSFGNPPSGNDGPFNTPGPSPVNSFDNPSFGSNAPSNPPVSPAMNQPNNPSLFNNAAGPSENWPSNEYGGQSEATSDISKNQAPSSGPPDSSRQNDKESKDYNNSPDNTALASTASPEISYSSQDSKSTDSDSTENSNWTTVSSNTDASQEKTAVNEKSDDEEQPCDERFKTALYEELINDERFCYFFTKLPVSATKPEVPKIIKHAFREYGIVEHYSEFSSLWRFQSRTLNKESTAEDWDEAISKILNIIFSRNNLLKGDCEEDGKKMASCILDTFPGDTASSSTENTNQNDGNDETSTESNSNSSGQKANTASNSTANASTENNSNSGKSTDSGSLSFPQMHSKLSSILKQDGSTQQNDDNVPFSELLDKFETQDMLGKLHRAAQDCMSPSGFDFDKFLPTMTNVTNSIKENHPDWSHDKCQKEMYSATIAVLTEELKNALKANNNNAESQPSSSQSDSVVDDSDAQRSNSGAQPEVPNDNGFSSDDSTYSGPRTDFASGSDPQQQPDFTDYGGYVDETGPGNIPSSEYQPGQGDWNAGFSQSSAPSFPLQEYPAAPPTSMNIQPYSGSQPFPASPNARFQQSPNFAPDSGVMNSPNGNFRNNQFQADYPSKDYGFDAGPSEARPVVPNDNSRNFPPHFDQDYDSGVPAGGPNYNTQPQFNSNYNSRNPANGPAIPQW